MAAYGPSGGCRCSGAGQRGPRGSCLWRRSGRGGRRRRCHGARRNRSAGWRCRDITTAHR
ncbi:MAG TPA: hypothetical protein DEV93_00995 [Chloroflexi bacterium]|nr:hypothetical protein [Chloroflexota bacterium]